MAISFDLDLAVEDVSRLTSPDAVAAFFQTLGYSTAKRTALTADAIGLQDPRQEVAGDPTPCPKMRKGFCAWCSSSSGR